MMKNSEQETHPIDPGLVNTEGPSQGATRTSSVYISPGSKTSQRNGSSHLMRLLFEGGLTGIAAGR